MANLRVYNPWNIFPSIFDDFDINISTPGAFPSIDIYEEGDKIILEAELPGYDAKDVEISIDEDGVVKISGKKEIRKEEKDKGKKYYVREISSRSFTRTIALPGDVDVKKANATFKNGILRLEVPKVKKAKALTVPIKVIKK